MNVVFVNYHDFTSNSAVHICRLAGELAGSGVSGAVVVPGDPSSIELIGGEHRFQVLGFRDVREHGLRFPDGAPPTLVHAWTPRENVRELTKELAARYHCPYFVHLEDNEDVITAHRLGLTVEQLLDANGDYDAAISGSLSHPRRMRQFLAGAAGITVVIDRLLEFAPDGVPAEVVWPAFEPDLFTPDPPDPELRRHLGLGDDEAVLVYAGNAHPSNAAEMRSLYLAVAAVNRAGRPLKLVRLGRDFVRFLDPEIRYVDEHVVRVPLLPRAEVGRHLRLADVLVQPGRPDAFNDYRFPSKLTEFFATGRPVVLPRANIGCFLADGEECILLERGDALEIAAVIERLLADDGLRERLGEAGRAFAERSFSWPESANKLRRFYERVLGTPRGAPPALLDDTSTLVDRDAREVPPPLSYATVRDYCDSADRLPILAAANGDMKDVQRPWALKTIVGAVQPGARLLEIGAGQPLVAELLARRGYDVTVVDPYDGRDRGPSDFEGLAAAFPKLHFIRGLFPDAVPAGERFACVYSISVFEHLPVDAIGETCAGIRRVTEDGGYTIHAVDHVQLGPGDSDHRARLATITGSLGLAERELDELLVRLAADPETYFLSAESHNRWRARVPYDEFPMRRCVSVQLCVQIGGAA
jgi:glycosyltransferase involved in cell wall biosynthesis